MTVRAVNMGTGILVCGLNGAGKSTLGKALAEKLHFYFIDDEELYFSKTDSDYIYASPCTHEEAEKRLFHKMQAHENFVLASVKGDYGALFYPFIQYTIWIDTPKDIRLQRVKNRSFQKFGSRILPGGDLYEKEKTFFEFVSSREKNTVEKQLGKLNCPVIKVDGMNSIEKNLAFILKQMHV